ncbi:MAG: UDP-N-acetylglucosamine 2-epimerase (non-hydrolyzing) [Fimbriimonadaceae bacterium]|nr:MAG: UDP-N-acetylglucosamine 2-epimerase [Armatimonadetes bacterium OLB18]WKZ81332.1 MAG: UDP-N-acetylglucosamine 2-epimerase (non-hydrolyzing) [Fimbriimonadaceae bacterium]
MGKPKVMFVVGTRPDAIKTAPVVLEFQKHERVETVLVSTGQHREMLAQALEAFGLRPAVDLAVMRHEQTLAELTARVLAGLDEVIVDVAPDYILAQGDTTTTFCASLAAFYRRIPYGHIEAGLRTETVSNPFPEEFNRRTTSLVAKHHFAPTRWAANNLLREGYCQESIFVTGNTGIDAVLDVAARGEQTWYPDFEGRVVLLTTHRRENWGAPQDRIARAARTIVDEVPDALLVVPMHRNPQVRESLKRRLGGHDRVQLIEPPDYSEFVKLMQRSYLILTDSGGVQEEAPAFGVPVLVLRDTTERPEGVEAGSARLVGTVEASILTASRELLSDPESRAKMAKTRSPYGDGRASQRIRSVVLPFLGIECEPESPWG